MKQFSTQLLRVHYIVLCGVMLNFLTLSDSYAQNTVTGKIIDENGEGLPGVSVVVKGTTAGSITDLEGNYSISVNEGAVLVFSYIGYGTVEETVGSRSVIDSQLALDLQELSEIVVVGYGTQKKSNLTGAVGVIDAESIAARPITSASQALQGQTSGVWINQASGEPGEDGASIRIRGIGTLNNADPLILVDGIEAPFDNINPNDIESITVLKDAASASIYGSRAANGVVLVTTKRGSRSEKPRITYSGYFGTASPTNLPGMVTNSAEFMELRNEADINAGSPAGTYTQAQIDQYRNIGENGNTDWLDEVFNSAGVQQHNLSISGGSEKTNYLVSVGYLNQKSPLENVDGLKRYMGRFNLDTDITDNFKIGTSLSFTQDDKNLDNINQDGGVLARTIRQTPNYPAFLSDGSGRFAQRAASLGEFVTPNPLAEIFSETRDEEVNRFLGSYFAEWEVIEGLKVRGTFATNYQSFEVSQFNRRADQYDWETGEFRVAENQLRRLENRFVKRLNLTSWLQTTYEKSFGSHNLKFLLGYNQESFDETNFEAARTTLPQNRLASLSTGNPATATNEGGGTEWALRSIFGRINYDFENRYLFEFNIRRDGSSRIDPDNRFDVFPSVSAGWVLSEEPFLANNSLIDFLKLRVSWGQLGNQRAQRRVEDQNGDLVPQDDNFPYASLITFGPSYNFGGNVTPGAAQFTIGNPEIQWETTSQTDIGLNVELLDGRLTFEGDYFIRNTNDILFAQPNPGVTGVREPTNRNLAKVQNRGWEIFAGWKNKVGDFSYGINFNLTHVESEVKNIDPAALGDADRVVDAEDDNFILLRGAPINALYGLKAIGVFQDQQEIDNAPDQSNFGVPAPGDLRYEDLNGDGTVDINDRQVIGQDNPTWIYGMNLNLGYKGFDVSAIFQGIGDAQTYGEDEFFEPFHNNAGLASYWLDRWTPTNPTNRLPRLATSGGINNSTTNSFWVQERAYMRLKNLQFGYTFPASMLENNFIESLRLFINGQNIWTVTDFQGFDPERAEKDGDGGSGYPQLQVWTFGANLSF